LDGEELPGVVGLVAGGAVLLVEVALLVGVELVGVELVVGVEALVGVDLLVDVVELLQSRAAS
jgi:hypothetical protein